MDLLMTYYKNLFGIAYDPRRKWNESFLLPPELENSLRQLHDMCMSKEVARGIKRTSDDVNSACKGYFLDIAALASVDIPFKSTLFVQRLGDVRDIRYAVIQAIRPEGLVPEESEMLQREMP